MAKSFSTILFLVSNVPLPFNTNFLHFITHILLFSLNPYFTFSIPINPTDEDRYLPPDDPNSKNLMVPHYDCETQHNLRQFNLLNVKQCTEGPSSIQHANIQAQVYVRAKTKRVRVFKCEAYAKKERKICFQSNIDVLIEPFGIIIRCHFLLHSILLNVRSSDLIRHLNGTDNKILNNFNYNKTFTLLEDHYSQEKLERFQTLFTVYQFNKVYTGAFT